MSHYSAIGGLFHAMLLKRDRLQRQVFFAMPLSKACLWIAIGHFDGKKWGCSSDTLRYHRKHSVTGLTRQVSRNRGGGVVSLVPIFCRTTKFQRCSVSKLFGLQFALVCSTCHRWLNPAYSLIHEHKHRLRRNPPRQSWLHADH